MKKILAVTHEFVEYIPNELKLGVVYVSIPFATVVHSCCCGCGSEVVTPISPTDWQLTFDGDSISLYPSIGSWNLECRSHYWIESNKVKWSFPWSKKEIEQTRHYDRLRKEKYFQKDGKEDKQKQNRKIKKQRKLPDL